MGRWRVAGFPTRIGCPLLSSAADSFRRSAMPASVIFACTRAPSGRLSGWGVQL
jgi:hypothetical protein